MLGLVKAVTIGKPINVALMRQKEIVVIMVQTLQDKKTDNRLELSTMGKDNVRITLGYGTILISDTFEVVVD